MPEPISPMDMEIDEANRMRAYPNPAMPESGAFEAARANPRLNETAERIGSAVGTAVDTVQHLNERLQQMKQRLTSVRGHAREGMANAAAEWKRNAQQTATEWKEAVEEKAEEWRRAAGRRVEATREGADRLTREYPIQTILAIAGGAFVLGAALRIWRSSNE